MTASAASGDEFDRKLHRGAVLRLTLDSSVLDDPDIDSRSKFVVVVSALLPDEQVWFVMCTSKTAHFDANPRFASDVLRWAPGEYPWCRTPVTLVDCTQAYHVPWEKLRELFDTGRLAFVGDTRPDHLSQIDQITRASRFLSPEEKRWIVPW
jgi:hypothetical protein